MVKLGKLSLALRAITLMVGFVIIAVLIYYIGLNEFLLRLEQANIFWIIGAIAVYGSSWIFRTERLSRLTSHAGQKISFFELFKLHISGYALNVILPAKLGDVATVAYLRMRDISIGRAAAIVVQSRILDVIALVLISLPIMAMLVFNSSPEWMYTSIIASTIIALVPIGIVVVDREKCIKSKIDSGCTLTNNNTLKKIISKIAEAYEGYHEIVSDKKMLGMTLLLSICIWLIDGLTCYAVSISIGASTVLFICIFSVMIANIGKSLPATPGSIGIYETILASVLIFMGVSPGYALAIAVIDHLIKNLFTLVIGLPATLNINVNIGVEGLKRQKILE